MIFWKGTVYRKLVPAGFGTRSWKTRTEEVCCTAASCDERTRTDTRRVPAGARRAAPQHHFSPSAFSDVRTEFRGAGLTSDRRLAYHSFGLPISLILEWTDISLPLRGFGSQNLAESSFFNNNMSISFLRRMSTIRRLTSEHPDSGRDPSTCL